MRQQRLPGTVLAAARLGQADQEMPAGTRVTVDGYGAGTVVEGFEPRAGVAVLKRQIARGLSATCALNTFTRH